ncbi:MAG: DNA-directed DNA polymerase II small subunit [Candidatus Thorarchaeota archaeon]
MTTTLRRSILKLFIKSGFQIAPDALDYILNLENPLEAAETVIHQSDSSVAPPVLSRDHIEGLLSTRTEIPESHDIDEGSMNVILPESSSSSPEETEWSINVVKNPTLESVGSAGTVDDFLALFNDRLRRIKRIYMSRIDTQGAISPRAARNKRDDARHYKAMNREGMRTQKRFTHTVIGMVKDKRISRSRNVIVQLEDPEDSIVCIIPTGREGVQGRELANSGNALLLDEVTCISGHIDRDGRMIAQSVIFPDIPTSREMGRARRDVYAIFISDLHYGSNEFLEDEFNSFINWVNSRDVDSSEKEAVQKIRYLFIAGDLVDGIGVYPSQYEDLFIPSIYDQYAGLAEKLRKIPKHVKIICIPGNHDACRQALPKPPIPEEYAKPLYDLGSQIMMMGDPSQLIVEDVNILLTHGDSLDDAVTQLPGATYKRPAIPMKEFLRKRHLVPMYGGRTELAPLHRDWMVIDTPPDIVHFGHAHHNAVDNYRGVQIINSGTFQGQTEFMRKQGIVPTPGIVTYVNLRTGAPEVKFFYKGLIAESTG